MNTLPRDFNYLTYIKINKDLEGYSKKDAKLHYLNHGLSEKRNYKTILPSDFNPQTYISLNPDLDGYSEKDAKLHYLNYGFFEKRNYKMSLPFDFDPQTYISLNPDLYKFNHSEACKHYIQYGMQELRKYKSKNIFHITHNFGGGTQVYVENIKNIFTTYQHNFVYIINENQVRINEKNIEIDEFANIIAYSCDILIVHHLLYHNMGYQIAFTMVDLLKKTTCLKIMFVHDYFLLIPSNPNPIKSDKIIPESKEVTNANKVFSVFNKIFFNSLNCYQNYVNYMGNINNSQILHVVPDIHFYNKRIIPFKKETYTIGLLGEIQCEHKGHTLAKNIITLINDKLKNVDDSHKYKFVILGHYEQHFPNLTATGRYDNKNIYKMIYDYDIDYFLFVSTFEETYSFTLSIALHTGLPIIYNNIGSYVERLSCYKNCFSFEENDINKIIEILENLDGKNEKFIKDFTRETKNLPKEYPKLYDNIPELSDYIKNEGLNFSLETIEPNLAHGNVCFMHITNVLVNGNSFGKQIFQDQIDSIKQSGLYDKLDYIFVIFLGEPQHLSIQDYKIKIIYYSKHTNEWEFPLLIRLKYFSDMIEKKIKILYIHTKGVFNKPHSKEWREYLEYFLIYKHDICLKLLDNYKCVGVNTQYYYDENKYRNHFSGNFWWANSDYIKQLPLFNSYKEYTYKTRHEAEHWLIGNLEKYDYRYFISLHHAKNNFYENHLEPYVYNLELIKNQVINNLKIPFNKTKKIYGVYFICCKGEYLDIINQQLEALTESQLYDVSDIILCFVCEIKPECINLLNKYEKIIIINVENNLYERFAINNFKRYLSGNYYLYYIHSKGITRNEDCFSDWRDLCNYFTIDKWRLSVELLNYYDCVGTNLKNFPKKHYSGNFWWATSEHLDTLQNVNEGYLSPEMYVCSNMKTNYVSIYQSNVNHGDTNYPKSLYVNLRDEDFIQNICIYPDFNDGDKKCINMCGKTNLNFEPPIIELS